MTTIVPTILAGGTGARLWPVSREGIPKQFLPLYDGRSMFRATLERVTDAQVFAKAIVITNEQYRFHAEAQAKAAGVDVDIPLELIEVQSGGDLGEDNIERLDGVFGRV